MGNGTEYECNMKNDIMLYVRDRMMVKLKKVRYLPGVKENNISQSASANLEFNERTKDPDVELANARDNLVATLIVKDLPDCPSVNRNAEVVGYYGAETDKLR